MIGCRCRRCSGGVAYKRVTDYLAAHQLEPGEFVLESEVEVDPPEWRRRYIVVRS